MPRVGGALAAESGNLGVDRTEESAPRNPGTRYWDGLSIEDVAAALGVNPSSPTDGPSSQAKVPNLTGSTEPAARPLLATAGLTLRAATAESADADKGRAVAQGPAACVSVERGSSTVTVPFGPVGRWSAGDPGRRRPQGPHVI